MDRNYYGLALKLSPNLLILAGAVLGSQTAILAGVTANGAITVATHNVIMDYYHGKITSPKVK